jgi:hypothetical protein
VAAEVRANRTKKEKVIRVELSRLAETAALDIPLARFGKIVRAATKQKVGKIKIRCIQLEKAVPLESRS